MLKMVAPEASYEQISGQILQNHDFLVGGKSGWYLFPAQELLQNLNSIELTSLALESLKRIWEVSRGSLESLWEVSGRSLRGLWEVS